MQQIIEMFTETLPRMSTELMAVILAAAFRLLFKCYDKLKSWLAERMNLEKAVSKAEQEAQRLLKKAQIKEAKTREKIQK